MSFGDLDNDGDQDIFHCVGGAYEGDLRNLIFHDLRWEPREKLADFDFVEGDRQFLERFYTGTYGD